MGKRMRAASCSAMLVLLGAALAGCSGKGGATETADKEILIENVVPDGQQSENAAAGETDAEQEALPAGNETDEQQSVPDTGNADSLFEEADVSGDIAELDEEGFRMIQEKVEESEDGGQIAVIATIQPEGEWTSVIYNTGTVFKRLEMDRASLQQLSLTEIAKDEMQVEDSVLLFGRKKEDGSWEADQVVTVIWK